VVLEAGVQDSEAGLYVRLIDFCIHSTLGLRVIKKKSIEARMEGSERDIHCTGDLGQKEVRCLDFLGGG